MLLKIRYHAVLLLEFDDCNRQWEELVWRINKTNSLVMTEPSVSIADMIIKRDAIKQKINALYKLSAGATIELNRYSRSEIIHRSAISVPEIQNQINELSKDYREIDTKLQALNWNTDLLKFMMLYLVGKHIYSRSRLAKEVARAYLLLMGVASSCI